MKRGALALIGSLTLLASSAVAQTSRTPLKSVAADQVVREITYCRGEYRLTMGNGKQLSYRELNLRFKTDASTYGPERGKPVLLPAGMQGDRGQVIFSGLDDLKRLVAEHCEGERP